jgi:polysaccharide biosynthesis transport protein
LLIAIPLILVPAAALVFSLDQERKYTTSASIIFRDSSSGAPPLASTEPEREAATNVRLLQQDVVEDRVARALGGSIPGDVSVIAEGDSNLVTVEVTANDPELAARIANTYARAYTTLRRRNTRRELRREQRRTQRTLEALPKDRATRGERLALRQRLAELAIAASGRSAVRRVGSAEPPTSASSPNPVRNTLLGALVGLILGIVLAATRDRLDRRIRDPEDLESAFGRPIIGRIPKSRALAKRRPYTHGLPPAEAEAFHVLRANLLYFAADRDARLVLVTSAEPEDGKTTVAWNLACAASSPGSRVLLVEGDLRRPRLARSFGVPGTPGLTELLSGEASLDDVLREVAVPASSQDGEFARTVHVMLAGSPAPNPLDLLDSERMRHLLETLAESYDLVLIDTPPTSAAADAIPLLSQVGGVIIVGRIAQSTYDSAIELSDLLTRLDAPTLGVVVNSDERRSYYYAPARRGA